jgi:hypothetical protein
MSPAEANSDNSVPAFPAFPEFACGSFQATIIPLRVPVTEFELRAGVLLAPLEFIPQCLAL